MSAYAKIRRLLQRQRASTLFPPLAYDEETGMILLDGGFLGAAFISPLLPGSDESTVRKIQSVLSMSLPPGSFIQFMLVSSPEVEHLLQRYAARRVSRGVDPQSRELLDEMVQRRVALFMRGRETPLLGKQGALVSQRALICAIKHPVRMPLEDRDIDEAWDRIKQFSAGLQAVGLVPMALDARQYLHVLRRMFHVYGGTSDSYDPTVPLRDQILGPGEAIQLTSNRRLRIDDVNISVLSIKTLPRVWSQVLMDACIGDPLGLDNQITMPFALCFSAHYPDQKKTADKVRAKSVAINYQAFGPMMRFAPKLRIKKEGIDVLIDRVEEGETLCEMNLTYLLFSRDEERLTRQIGSLTTYLAAQGLEMAEERYIHWPVFWNCLPLFPSSESIRLLHRYHTMGVSHASHFVPMLGDWSGTGSGAATLFLSRRAQPVMFDLYDSESSYNAIVFAESGAGKTFLTQRLITDYLSLGAKVWVIDVGRSYYKLARLFDGEFLVFHDRSEVCMNPFTQVADVDEEMDLLKNLLAKMAAPSGQIDDYHYATLEEAVKAVWGHKGPAMTITDIAEYLSNQEDSRNQDMGRMLFPYTRHGAYGMWFEGENNLRWDRDFVVLELEELKAKPDLQRVVLMQLIAKIQHEMYLGNDQGRPQIVIIDEAWDLLNEPAAARFMESGFRRFRKYGGAAIVVTQSLGDLYQTPSGRAIASNCPIKIIMQQLSGSIAAARENKWLDLPEYGWNLLHTIRTHPGKYSEFMVHTEHRWGIARLIEDRFAQVVFSSKGAERTEVIRMIDEGMDARAAVESFIRAEHAMEAA